MFVGENAPRGAAINYYLKSAATGDVKITIADVNGRVIRTLDGTEDRGHQPRDVEPGAAAAAAAVRAAAADSAAARGGVAAVEPGTYIVTLEVGGKKLTKPLQVLQDRWLGER